MARGTLPPDPNRPRGDEYVVEQELRARREPISNQLVRVARGALVIVLVLISMALFWLIGMMLDIL